MATQTPLAWLQSAVNRAVSFVVGLLWKPTDIPGCLLWLRPSRGVTKSGSLVSKWADQAGKHTVTTPSVIERPTFVQHSDAFHQRPAIRFDGVGDLLEKEGDISLPFQMEELSAFVVLSQATVGVANGTPLLWTGSSGHVGIQINGSNEFHAYLEYPYASGVTLLTGKAYVLGIVYANEKATLYVNGAPVKTFTGAQMWQTNSGATARLRIGGESAASSNFHGDLGDVVIYGRALTDAEVDKVNAELLEHYGIGSGKLLDWSDAFKDLLAKLRGWLERQGVIAPRNP